MAEIGEVIRLTMFYTAPAASVAENVFHFVVDVAAIDDEDILPILTSFTEDQWIPGWEELGSSDAELDIINADVMNLDGTVARNLGQFGINASGAEMTGVLPAANSGYLNAATALPKARGSKYVPFVGEGTVDNGSFNPSALVELALLLAVYVTTLSSGGSGVLIPGILSKTLQVFEEFNQTGLIRDEPAYQRRRKLNVGS